MMNKKILISVAAAATLATIFTGCGSDITSAGSVTNGVAQKAALDGATVTIGTATPVTTDDTGAYSVTGATGSTISVSGGVMNMPDGSTVDNNLTLESTISADNPNNIVSMATTLIKAFVDSGLTTAQASTITKNLLNLSDAELYTAPDNLTATSATAVNAKKNRQANIWAMLSNVQNSTTAKAAMLADFNTTAGAIAITDAAFQATVTTAITAASDADTTLDLSDLNTSTQVTASTASLVLQEEAVVKAAATASTTVTEIAFSNVLNIEGNATIGYGYDLNGTVTNVDYASKSTIPASTANFDDANNTKTFVSLKDYNSTNPTGETGEVLLSFTNTDTNASYVARLDKLTVATASDYVTLAANANTTLVITANSNTSTKINITDGNATALLSGLASDSNATSLVLNISAFANYVRSLAEAESSTTNGNFTTDIIGSGNYSIAAYADLNDKNVTYNSRLSKAPRGTVTVSGTDYDGYKLLDANLTK